MDETHTANDVLEIIKKTTEQRKINATRVANLFFKYKKWLRTNYETTDFQQPIMFFERRSGEVEFYENVTTGLFEYKHSDGTQRYLIITPSRQKRFGFADKIFKGYYCHEDYPTPLPDNPFLTVEQVNIMVDKALNDIKEWKAKEIQANTEMIWKIALGIAIIGGVYVLYRMLVPQTPPPPGTTTIVKNLSETTITVLNTTKII